MRRGFTLIELMIAVAICGIVAAGAVAGVGLYRQAGSDALLRERARQVLEAEAQAIVTKTPVTEAQRAKLVADLPGAELTRRSENGITHLEVRWKRTTGGTGTSELAVAEAR